jgi:2-methylfumaryl-CoA isomerase
LSREACSKIRLKPAPKLSIVTMTISPAHPAPRTSPILAGLRIIEASAFVAVPLGGMTLAQMGADVIRIDPPGGGLDYRRWPVTEDNTSLFWCGLNKQKRSVVIDVAKPEGREIASALICAPGEGGGIVLTNLPPRGYLDFEALRARRPDVIQLTLSGDRHGGSAVDYTINPKLGLPYLTGSGAPDSVVNHVLPAWDLCTGNLAALGLLAAERHRLRSGEGQHVRLSLEDVAMATMGHLGFIAEPQRALLSTSGRERPRERINNDLFGAFGRDFRCADGARIMIVALTLKQWRSLLKATELTAAMDELALRLGVNLNHEGERYKAREAIAGVVGPWIALQAFNALEARFNEHGVCWSRYQTVTQWVQSDPSCSLDNPMFNEVEQAGVGRILSPGLALDFSGFTRHHSGPAPRLGQHTEEIMLDVLRMSTSEFGRWVDQGILAPATGP